MLKRHLKIVVINLWLFSLALSTISCAVNPVSGQRELMLLSESKEIQLGRQADSHVVQEYGIYDDSNLTNYLNGVYQRLAKLSHRPNLQYRFKILDASVVNAFAVPGGYVYFTRGILANLNSEAELAGVMGHEIGHITARHSAQQLSRAQLAQIGMGVGMIFSETFRDLAQLAQFGIGMLFLNFSRDNERQADDLGVEYASKAGYDATHMANFFETLNRMGSSSDRSGLPSWFSTHPDPEDRVRAVRTRAREWNQKLGTKNLKINRERYLKSLDGLVFGEDPRQGYIKNSTFYHPTLRFQFLVPANWKLQNTQTVIRIMNEKKDAIIMLTISSARSPEEAARNFVSKSKASVLESRRTNINRLAAYQLISQISSQQGLLRIISYFIQKSNKVYVFHGFSQSNRFSSYVPTFRYTMERFNDLNDPERLNVKPDRLRVRSTPKTGSLGQVLRALGAPENKLKALALLNGKSLDERVPAKTLLKLVAK